MLYPQELQFEVRGLAGFRCQDFWQSEPPKCCTVSNFESRRREKLYSRHFCRPEPPTCCTVANSAGLRRESAALSLISGAGGPNIRQKICGQKSAKKELAKNANTIQQLPNNLPNNSWPETGQQLATALPKNSWPRICQMLTRHWPTFGKTYLAKQLPNVGKRFAIFLPNIWQTHMWPRNCQHLAKP